MATARAEIESPRRGGLLNDGGERVEIRALRVHRAFHIRFCPRPELGLDVRLVSSSHQSLLRQAGQNAANLTWYNIERYPITSVAMLDTDQRRLLGEFVRAHRERSRPARAYGRSRTPGLRREELAERAGISTTGCAWIEQGRAVQASPETLSRLADALALSRAERAYLFELAGRVDPKTPSDPTADAPASLRAVIAAIEHPAYGLDRLWNACCWNDAAASLFRGWLDGNHQRNLLRFVLSSPAARKLIPEWEDRARRLLAEFRADYSHNFRDARVRALVDALRRESPLFSKVWNEQDVRYRAGGLRTFQHPDKGLLRFEQHAFSLAERPDYKLVVLLPASADATNRRCTGTRRRKS